MLGGIEDVKAAIAALINSEGAGANDKTFRENLLALDLERGGTLVSPTPAQVETTEKAQLTAYPACQVIGLDTEFDQEAGPTLQDGPHRIVIVWLHVDDDEARVTTVIERLILAARQTLWGSVLGGGLNAGPVQVVREDYSDLARADNAFLKGGRSFIAVPTLVQ